MKKLDYKKIEAIILDFDGVLTNNFAYVNEFGEESVRISRADGLAFDAIKYLGLKCYILSSEKNEVVKQRSKKLGIKCFAGIKDKKEKLISICSSNKININRVIYIGNDVNDLIVIRICGYSCCPKDSHPLIKKNVTKCLHSNGGDGVVRELIEKILKIDITNFL